MRRFEGRAMRDARLRPKADRGLHAGGSEFAFRMTKLPILALLLAGVSAWAADPARPSSEPEKLGYALGVDMGRNMRERGVPIDPGAFIRGFVDGIERNRTALNPKELEAVKRKFDEEIARRRRAAREDRMRRHREASENNLSAGKSFLKRNRKKPGVIELESGLQYRELRPGTGPKPTGTSRIRLHYRGMTITGEEFETSHGSGGGPVETDLDGVMKGWQEALLLMNEGAKWKVFTPSDLAHGERGNPPVIGPNQVLVFELELISVD